MIRFEESGQQEDIDEALSLHRAALRLLPAAHPNRPVCLGNIANALRARFEILHQQEDIDDSISLHRDVLQLQPAPHPDRRRLLNNLAAALGTRFKRTGQREDLDASINMYYECLNTFGSSDPLTCGVSSNLGGMLATAYFHTHELEYLFKAMAAFQVAVACEAAPISQRFGAAKMWATHADNSRHESALDAYHTAIEFLPHLAMLGLDVRSRQQALTSGSDGLARDAAACAIRSGRHGKAVELLEEGRAVFWTQALQLHKPMTDLRNAAPELEERLRSISIALEQGSFRDLSRSLSDSPQEVMSMEQEVSRFRRLNDEWMSTLEQVRGLHGFQDFLRPSRLSTLQQAATNGPVVILNASKTACTALILTSTGVQHIPFPDLNFRVIARLVNLLRYAIAQGGRNTLLLESDRALVEGVLQQTPVISDTLRSLRLPLERHVRRVSGTSAQPDEIFRFVLGVLWESVAEPIIRMLELEVVDSFLIQTRSLFC
jgi:tetratricopeptide (TPR) repeat protein